ncbi:hypothetical protein [Saccharopolyspora taberi]|uniref:Uncharacterized protein n=1 Tax=Saccharopolyspora taberi TaxID=60895 RepID=A0ABN3VDW3_9PSEU
MGSPEQRAAATRSRRVRDVVRDVVEQVADEELPVVDGLSRFDDDTVVRRLGRRDRQRDPLGFGLGELAVMVTPVVWLVLDQVVKQVTETAVDSAATGTKNALRKLFGRKRGAAPEVPELTPEQLGEVRQRVLDAALHRGLPQEQAEEVADAVVARLAIAAPSDDTDDDTDGQEKAPA